MPDLAILSALPCRLFGSKLVLDVHDTMPELYLDKFGGRQGRIGARMLMLQERLSARLADRVLAVHDLHAERLHQSGVPQRKLVVIANSPDPRIFPVADVECQSRRVRSEPGDGTFSIICHGTISRRLGLDTTLAALALLHQRFPLIRLRIIGAGDYLNELKALSRKLRVESAISFEGPVPIQELAAKTRRGQRGPGSQQRVERHPPDAAGQAAGIRDARDSGDMRALANDRTLLQRNIGALLSSEQCGTTGAGDAGFVSRSGAAGQSVELGRESGQEHQLAYS